MTDQDDGHRIKTDAHIDYSVLEKSIGYTLRRAQLFVQQDFTTSFAEMCLKPGDFTVLLVVGRNPGLKQSEVAEAVGVQRANFVAIIDNLEEHGLLERRKDDNDRRVHSLYLTSEGQRHLEKLLVIWNAREKRLIARLGGEENRDHLVALLRKLDGGF